MQKELLSASGERLLSLHITEQPVLKSPRQYPLYTILFLPNGRGVYKADFGIFRFEAPAILFSTPFQTLQLTGTFDRLVMLQFHGDFYCIEYHKKEVACNGLLFNNIYIEPYVLLRQPQTAFFERITHDLMTELSENPPPTSVITAYLQLLLAKATTIKTASMRSTGDPVSAKDERMEMFSTLIEQYFLLWRKPSQYAARLHLSPDSLAKRCKTYFRKSPTQLIHERIVLEAKKKLHLTRKSIKEIAYDLKFEDAHYFSRFFKKLTGISPQVFRTRTGISIVADLSMQSPESSIPPQGPIR